MFYRDLEERKEKVRQFIKDNPRSTHKEIKKKLHTKIDKLYKGGMAEAFRDAGVNPPRTFKIKTKEEKRKILIDYIKKHPTVGGHIIKKDTKINFLTIFKNTKALFDAAGIEYLKNKDNRGYEEKKAKIIQLVKEDPLISSQEIMKITGFNLYNFFENMKEIYRAAGVEEIKKGDKRRLKKRKAVINFIKLNPLATQREINIACKTHVQDLFEEGIFEAYELAGIEFPYSRLKLYGVAIKDIKKRSKDFEEMVAIKLSAYGKVNRLVKTKRGFADVILERNGKKIILEIKDYLAKDISISQIKQLNKYLEDCNCDMGILICHEKPTKDKFLIGKNRIFVVANSELNLIPQIIDMGL
ncbi:MAG: hypothetical protein AABY22_27365 [Nanoarchaeota archaeon]